jgi:metallo-beta-lactamase family protein
VIKLVFSGDLGVKDKPILRDPETIDEADYLIMETTYGDRIHESSHASLDKFFDIILTTTRRGGSVIIRPLL